MNQLKDAGQPFEHDPSLMIEQIKTIDAHLARALDACVQTFALSSLPDLLEKIELAEHGDIHD